MKYTPENITRLAPDEIFVFGSNLMGIHGKGAAKQALQWGAVKNKGFGKYGQTYAIPTKYSPYKSLSLYEIQKYVQAFLGYAAQNEDLIFLVTAIGCGNAGYSTEEIAPMFRDALKIENIRLPKAFVDFLMQSKQNKPQT